MLRTNRKWNFCFYSIYFLLINHDTNYNLMCIGFLFRSDELAFTNKFIDSKKKKMETQFLSNSYNAVVYECF